MKSHFPYSPGLSDEVEIDMSPMIDLVFLLLIFFMTGSTMISYLKDQRVILPVAEDARVPKAVRARFVVNVYEDGTYGNEHGEPRTLAQLAGQLRAAAMAEPGVRLFVRPDRRVAHRAVRTLLDTARDAGVDKVIFSAYTRDRGTVE